IVPRCDLPPGAGGYGRSIRDAGGIEGRTAAAGIPRGCEGRRGGAVAIDFSGVGAGGTAREGDFGDRTKSGAGACGRAGRDDRGCAGGAAALAVSRDAVIFLLPLWEKVP